MGSRWRAGSLVGIACAACIAGNANWSAPPRFDGAGYAVLARALLERQSYRAIDQPDEPRHGHFPPGYPAVLAAVWEATGISVRAGPSAIGCMHQPGGDRFVVVVSPFHGE